MSFKKRRKISKGGEKALTDFQKRLKRWYESIADDILNTKYPGRQLQKLNVAILRGFFNEVFPCETKRKRIKKRDLVDALVSKYTSNKEHPFLKREKEKHNIESLTLHDLDFELCGIRVPFEVIMLILRCLVYDMKLLQTVGSVNSSFYLLILSTWSSFVKFRTNESILKVSLLVLKSMRKFCIRDGISGDKIDHLLDNLTPLSIKEVSLERLMKKDLRLFIRRMKAKKIVFSKCSTLTVPNFMGWNSRSKSEFKELGLLPSCFPNVTVLNNPRDYGSSSRNLFYKQWKNLTEVKFTKQSLCWPPMRYYSTVRKCPLLTDRIGLLLRNVTKLVVSCYPHQNLFWCKGKNDFRKPIAISSKTFPNLVYLFYSAFYNISNEYNSYRRTFGGQNNIRSQTRNWNLESLSQLRTLKLDFRKRALHECDISEITLRIPNLEVVTLRPFSMRNAINFLYRHERLRILEMHLNTDRNRLKASKAFYELFDKTIAAFAFGTVPHLQLVNFYFGFSLNIPSVDNWSSVYSLADDRQRLCHYVVKFDFKRRQIHIHLYDRAMDKVIPFQENTTADQVYDLELDGKAVGEFMSRKRSVFIDSIVQFIVKQIDSSGSTFPFDSINVSSSFRSPNIPPRYPQDWRTFSSQGPTQKNIADLDVSPEIEIPSRDENAIQNYFSANKELIKSFLIKRGYQKGFERESREYKHVYETFLKICKKNENWEIVKNTKTLELGNRVWKEFRKRLFCPANDAFFLKRGMKFEMSRKTKPGLRKKEN